MATAKNEEHKIKHSEAKGLFLFTGAFLCLLSLLSFQFGEKATNWLGPFGYFLALGLQYLFGLSSFLIVGFIIWMSWKLLCNQEIPEIKFKIFYFSILIISTSILLNVIAEKLSLPFLLKMRVFSESVIFPTPYPHLYTRYNLGGVPFIFSIGTFLHLTYNRCFMKLGSSLLL